MGGMKDCTGSLFPTRARCLIGRTNHPRNLLRKQQEWRFETKSYFGNLRMVEHLSFGRGSRAVARVHHKGTLPERFVSVHLPSAHQVPGAEDTEMNEPGPGLKDADAQRGPCLSES